MSQHRGFALLAVLWVTVALGAIAAGAVARARLDATATGESIVRMRARWAAEGCLAATLSHLDDSLRARSTLDLPATDTLFYANGMRCTTETVDPSTRSDLAARYGDGRINLNGAPDSVIASLPGIGSDALRVVDEARTWRRPLRDLNDLAGRMTPPARAQLLGSYPELLARTTFHTSSLVLTTRAWVEGSWPAGHIEVLVVAAGDRAAVVRRRMW